MTSTLTGTSDIFNDTSRLPELYFVNGQTNCLSLPSEYDAGLLTTYTKSPAVETKTIETLTFSMLDTSCLIVVRKKAPSGRLIDDRITIVKLNSASFEIVGNGGEPAIETPTTTTTTTTTTTPISEPCCAGNACEQLKEVLKIKDPYADSNTLVAEVPSPNPVSNTVGETDGFGILYPLAVGGSVPGPISVNTQGHTTNLPGLRFLFASGSNPDLSHQINPTQTLAQAIGGNFWSDTSGTNCQDCRLETMALSIVDFNNFRAKVEDAINILDGKIRQILAVQEPTCP